MIDVVVVHLVCHILISLFDLSAIFIHGIAHIIAQREVNVFADVAVESAAELEPVAVDRHIIFVDHAGQSLQ